VKRPQAEGEGREERETTWKRGGSANITEGERGNEKGITVGTRKDKRRRDDVRDVPCLDGATRGKDALRSGNEEQGPEVRRRPERKARRSSEEDRRAGRGSMREI